MVLSLDLQKAFDTVDHSAILKMLKSYGVPASLIERITKACLPGDVCVRWRGKYTKYFQVNRGVKQGCPISGMLFILVLHFVIKAASERLPFFTLEQIEDMKFPCILAFADDIIILFETEEQIAELLTVLCELLAEVGLNVNWSKSCVLIRDPEGQKERPEDVQEETHLHFGDFKLPKVDHFLYLGSTITSSLERPQTIRNRVKAGYKALYSLLPFLQENRLPWDLISILYTSIITPTVVYGLKVAAVTRQNRISLRHFERNALKLLFKVSSTKPTDLRVSSLVRNLTITRQIAISRIQYWSHVTRRPEGHLLKLAESFVGGPRKHGRPCLTWSDMLQKAIRWSDHSSELWKELMQQHKIPRAILQSIRENPELSDTDPEIKSEDSDGSVVSNEDEDEEDRW